MLPYILAAVGLLLLGLVIYVATRPSEFRITRSAVVSGPPEKVFAHVNDLHLWQEWSPWAKIDPNCRNTFDGPASGKGAVFKWDGNRNVGSGVMTITDSRQPEFVQIRLEFLRPFKATNTAELSLKPEGSGTSVTWTMYGPNTIMSRIMGLFMSFDRMVGGQFEQGLKNLDGVMQQPVA